jgi:hypothetical protein
MPQIFSPYRGCVMLGIGELAIRRFAELAPRSRVSLLRGLLFGILYAGDGPNGTIPLQAHRRKPRPCPASRRARGLVIHEARAAGLPVVVSDTCKAEILCEGCGFSGHSRRCNKRQGLRWCVSLTPEERPMISLRGCGIAGTITMKKIGDAVVRHAREASACQ